jgi:chaperonin GroES
VEEEFEGMGEVPAPGVDTTLIQAINIAERLDEDTLNKIGRDIVDWYAVDEDSRADWLAANEKWLKLATQITEGKDFPWPNASNVKYPLLTTTAVQFHARSYPALVNDAAPVKVTVIGKDDEQETKRKRASRVQSFMGFQLFEQMPDWVDSMDRLLFILPIVGMVFKKTYYSPAKERNVSELVLPQDVALNYHATDFERARKTHRIWMDQNELVEYQNKEIFLDVDLADPEYRQRDGIDDLIQGRSPLGDEDAGDYPYELLESHCWLDLDEDGYKEPYIVTVDHDSCQVLRIVSRYSITDVEYRNGKVAKIIPEEMFTQYIFLPDPSSPLYGLGFGNILGPINSASNTILNQLIDAGTLSNTGGGFLSRGIRMRGGATKFTPGEWKVTQASGEELSRGIFPLPVREPSMVLFQLLGTLIESGERLASVTDIMTGQNPGQNQPYSTTVTVLEQGQKVFVGIYKRIYRALTSEYKKMFRLNGQYLDNEFYLNILDEPDASGIISKDDFNLEDFNIRPGADPSLISEAQKLMRAESLMQKMMAGIPLNQEEVTRRLLEAEGHEDIEKLMDVPAPPPPLDLQLEIQKFEHQVTKDMLELELNSMKAQFAAMKDQATAMMNAAKAESETSQSSIDQLVALHDAFKKISADFEATLQKSAQPAAPQQPTGTEMLPE